MIDQVQILEQLEAVVRQREQAMLVVHHATGAEQVLRHQLTVLAQQTADAATQRLAVPVQQVAKRRGRPPRNRAVENSPETVSVGNGEQTAE